MSRANVDGVKKLTAAPPPASWRERHRASLTITGTALLAVGAVLVIAGAPLFGRPAPQSNADFPTCFFFCDGTSIATLLISIGGAHLVAGGVAMLAAKLR